jgi:predicted nuclease of predicted toxin-antitoxin system
MHDRDVLSLANAEERVLITNDRDFGELIFRQQLRHSGGIFFRLGEESISTKVSWLAHVLNNHRQRLEERRFLVVTDRGVRIRPRPTG